MLARTASLAIWFSAALAGASLGSHAWPPTERDAPPHAPSNVEVRRDAQGRVAAIAIRARHGRIAWADVAKGLAPALDLNDDALGNLPKERSPQIDAPRAKAWLDAMQIVLPRGVRLDATPAAAKGDEPRLVITLDRQALLAFQRRWKARLRRAANTLNPRPRQYGLKWDPGWESKPADMDLVVAIHGLQSEPEQVKRLLDGPRRQGMPCGFFEYPNDQPVTESARLLSQELRALSQRQPNRGVSLLAHSMGGLVARAAIEAPGADSTSRRRNAEENSPAGAWSFEPAGNVRRLIMIATPNHGSELARYVRGGDLVEFAASRKRREDASFLFGAIEDGLAEAASDLMPGSPFLEELNSRTRNARVSYTLILGDRAPLRPEDLQRLREIVQRASEKSRVARLFGPRADAWLQDLDEVIDGRGDGVVAVRRGQLEGVDDTLVLHFSHLEMLREHPQGDAGKVHEIVLQRLQN